MNVTGWLFTSLAGSWWEAPLARLRGHSTPERSEAAAAPPAAPAESSSDPQHVVAQMLGQGRYAFLLRPQIARTLGDAQLRSAESLLLSAMVPCAAGPVRLLGRNWGCDTADDDEASAEHFVNLDAYLLDRYSVTNRQFFEFVRSGGYRQVSFWDPAIRGAIGEFRDASGEPGPRFWRHGHFPDGLDHHPVVGVSWYEAAAYACWIGKRLPSDPEWVRAAAVPVPTNDGRLCQRKFPWGDSYDPSLANLWEAGQAHTVPVHEFAAGQSPAGIQQLVGNVWEWTTSDYGAWDVAGRPEGDVPLKSLRGGAFDTYFPQQASWQFQSGDSLLARRRNVGFRCALSACDVFPVSNRTENSAP